MNTKAMVTGTISIVVAVVLLSCLLVPIIGNASSTTESIQNEGASWMRYAKMDGIIGTDITVSKNGTDITIENGPDTITHEMDGNIIYFASSNGVVSYQDNSTYVMFKGENSTTLATLSYPFTIKEVFGSIVVDDGVNEYDM